MKYFIVIVTIILQMIVAVPVRRHQYNIMDKSSYSNTENPVTSQMRRGEQFTYTSPVSPRSTDVTKQKYVEYVNKFAANSEVPNIEPFAAFAGDNCATGFMRFGDICIDGDA